MDTTNFRLAASVPGGAAISPSNPLLHASGRSVLEPGEFLRHLEVKQSSSAAAGTPNPIANGEEPAAVGTLPMSGSGDPADEDQVLMGYARKWVSQTFFGTLLKQMRESPFKSDLFSGGRGGEAFGSLYDQHLADRMARGAGRQLAESIVRQIKQRQSTAGGRKAASDSAGTVSIAA